MALAAPIFTRQAVAELVKHLRKTERNTQQNKVFRPEKLLELRQLRTEMVELDSDQQQRGRHHNQTKAKRYRMEAPSNVRHQPVEEAVRVDAFKTNRQNVRTLRHHLLATAFLAPFQEFVPLVRNADDDQAALVQLPDERLNLFQRNLLRRKARLERLLDRVETFRSVELF